METKSLDAKKYSLASPVLTQEEIEALRSELAQSKILQGEITKESINNGLVALEREARETVIESSRLSGNLDKAGKKLWRQSLVIWAVGIALAVSYIIFLNHKPTPISQTHQEPAYQQLAEAKSGTEKASEPARLRPSEQEDLLKLLSQIREAQLQKDIHMFMDAYSRDFPGLGQKLETILSIWEEYTYVDSQFMLTDLRQENASTISGKVIWDIQAKERKTGTMTKVTKAYFVTFSKQSGKWLIKAITKEIKFN